MLTAFGKILRKIRIDRNELLKNMADNLNITSAYLSSIENGKRAPTETILNSVITYYSLSENDINDLKHSYFETLEEITINTDNMSDRRKDISLSFARKIESMSEDDLEKIKAILRKSN